MKIDNNPLDNIKGTKLKQIEKYIEEGMTPQQAIKKADTTLKTLVKDPDTSKQLQRLLDKFETSKLDAKRVALARLVELSQSEDEKVAIKALEVLAKYVDIGEPGGGDSRQPGITINADTLQFLDRIPDKKGE